MTSALLMMMGARGPGSLIYIRRQRYEICTIIVVIELEAHRPTNESHLQVLNVITDARTRVYKYIETCTIRERVSRGVGYIDNKRKHRKIPPPPHRRIVRSLARAAIYAYIMPYNNHRPIRRYIQTHTHTVINSSKCRSRRRGALWENTARELCRYCLCLYIYMYKYSERGRRF